MLNIPILLPDYTQYRNPFLHPITPNWGCMCENSRQPCRYRSYPACPCAVSAELCSPKFQWEVLPHVVTNGWSFLPSMSSLAAFSADSHRGPSCGARIGLWSGKDA